MTEDEVTLLAIKGAISELPEDQRVKCEGLIHELKGWGATHGFEPLALAVALLGAELQMAGGDE